MIPVTTNKRILELYSGKRNRNIYPNPSSFEVNFASTMNKCGEKIIQDPVCKGQIYYTFNWEPQNDKTSWFTKIYGSFLPGSTQEIPVLNFVYQTDVTLTLNYENYMVGWIIYRLDAYNLAEYRTITSYDPSTNTISLDKPFTDPLIIDDYTNGFAIFSILPQTWSIYIPTVDINRIVINKTPLYYNGYYVVFETPNSAYSNPTNSNIFSRKISYYDYQSQLAYFDEPLPFSYDTTPPFSNQTWTLRKSLPLERWTLDKPSYFKSTRSDNPLIGPLPGYVVVLPDEASSIDNYYKGKYIYVVSNSATTYSPPLPPQSDILPINDAFYPIYGLFYIRAYNGETKEASIQQINNNKYTDNINNIPNYVLLDSINIGSFVASDGVYQITNEGLSYKLTYASSSTHSSYPNVVAVGDADLYLRRGTYQITFRVKSVNTLGYDPLSYFEIYNGSVYYIPTYIVGGENQIDYLNNSYRTFTFTVVVSDSDFITFQFLSSLGDPADYTQIYFEWDLLEVIKADTINIVELDHDNYAPLDYNGTMVSTNDTVCYDISIESLTLPNKELSTGSSIAFYPFVYVQIENLTSPTRVSPNVIISNNPPSTKAVFTVSVPQIDNPEFQKFITLYTKESHIIKFKANDNLKFSVFLPDGTPFSTLLPDTLSPYPSDPSLQIHVVFQLTRIN
jgi:hypothetical protein